MRCSFSCSSPLRTCSISSAANTEPHYWAMASAEPTLKRRRQRRSGLTGGDSSRCNTPHRCFERVKSLLGVGATEDEPLPNLLPGARNPLDVLLTDDPLTVNEDVALMEHKLGP
jgi:hypothetical protein